MEHLQSEEPFSSDPYFSDILHQLSLIKGDPSRKKKRLLSQKNPFNGIFINQTIIGCYDFIGIAVEIPLTKVAGSGIAYYGILNIFNLLKNYGVLHILKLLELVGLQTE